MQRFARCVVHACEGGLADAMSLMPERPTLQSAWSRLFRDHRGMVLRGTGMRGHSYGYGVECLLCRESEKDRVPRRVLVAVRAFLKRKTTKE